MCHPIEWVRNRTELMSWLAAPDIVSTDYVVHWNGLATNPRVCHGQQPPDIESGACVVHVNGLGIEP